MSYEKLLYPHMQYENRAGILFHANILSEKLCFLRCLSITQKGTLFIHNR